MELEEPIYYLLLRILVGPHEHLINTGFQLGLIKLLKQQKQEAQVRICI